MIFANAQGKLTRGSGILGGVVRFPTSFILLLRFPNKPD
jgi:hypothetical protein